MTYIVILCMQIMSTNSRSTVCKLFELTSTNISQRMFMIKYMQTMRKPYDVTNKMMNRIWMNCFSVRYHSICRIHMKMKWIILIYMNWCSIPRKWVLISELFVLISHFQYSFVIWMNPFYVIREGFVLEKSLTLENNWKWRIS